MNSGSDGDDTAVQLSPDVPSKSWLVVGSDTPIVDSLDLQRASAMISVGVCPIQPVSDLFHASGFTYFTSGRVPTAPLSFPA